jgi:hypothetical protein
MKPISLTCQEFGGKPYFVSSSACKRPPSKMASRELPEKQLSAGRKIRLRRLEKERSLGGGSNCQIPPETLMSMLKGYSYCYPMHTCS